MLVIPAIDIRGGNCVRLFQGKFSDETVYSPSPLSMAEKFTRHGAQRIHIVDLDGAFSGKMKNADVISSIARETGVPVQVGGGIRDRHTVETLLEGGIDRVIMGTGAVYNKQLLREILKKWPGRLSVGIDSVEGKAATGGWKDISSKRADKLAVEMEEEGVEEIIVTDIKKDGTLEGPSLRWIKKIASAVSISVIASGGIGRLDDIRAIKELGMENIAGVIVGKAIYSGSFSLPEAIEAAG